MGAEFGELDPGPSKLGSGLIFKTFGEFGATVWAYGGICRDLLVADRAVETEFGATVRARCFFSAHRAPTLGALYHVDVLVIAG